MTETEKTWLYGLAVAAGVILMAKLTKRDSGPPPVGSASKWFTWHELTDSATARERGLSNNPDEDARKALVALATMVLDRIREGLGRPVGVTDAYRAPAVNVAVGGEDNSQHMRGEAADITVSGFTSRQLAAAILRLDPPVPFDQLIWYELKPHVHVSYATGRARQRADIRCARADGSYPKLLPTAVA